MLAELALEAEVNAWVCVISLPGYGCIVCSGLPSLFAEAKITKYQSNVTLKKKIINKFAYILQKRFAKMLTP